MIKALMLSLILAISTAQLLEIGFIEMSAGNTRAAIIAFEDTLNSRDLNSTGRALVYWNLHLLYEKHPINYNMAGEYLLFFITQSEMILESVDGAGITHPWFLFAKTQNLRERIAMGKIKLDKMWNEVKWKNSLEKQLNSPEKAPTK